MCHRFAYVDFSTAEACHRAVKLSEGHLGASRCLFNRSLFSLQLAIPARTDQRFPSSFVRADGRALLIKLGSDFSSRPITPATIALPENKTKSRTVQALLSKQKNAPGPTLFVGNLGCVRRSFSPSFSNTRADFRRCRFEATEESLRTLIEEHWQTSLSSSKHSSKQRKSVFRPEPVVEGEDKKVVAPAEDVEEGEEGAEKDKVEVVGKDGMVEEIEVSGAGLRKIRMGQFQDTGRCKG